MLCVFLTHDICAWNISSARMHLQRRSTARTEKARLYLAKLIPPPKPLLVFTSGVPAVPEVVRADCAGAVCSQYKSVCAVALQLELCGPLTHIQFDHYSASICGKLDNSSVSRAGHWDGTVAVRRAHRAGGGRAHRAGGGTAGAQSWRRHGGVTHSVTCRTVATNRVTHASAAGLLISTASSVCYMDVKT